MATCGGGAATCGGGAVTSGGGAATFAKREELGRREREEREGKGKKLVGKRGPGGGLGGPGPRDCGINSVRLRSEARFELLSSARLRALICMRWAVPR
jgi:hypothetical protein